MKPGHATAWAGREIAAHLRYRNASVEIYLRIENTKHDLMHLIVDRDGHSSQAIEDHVTLDGKREPLRWPKRFDAPQSSGQWVLRQASRSVVCGSRSAPPAS